MAENREERDAGGGDGDTPDQASHLISSLHIWYHTHTKWRKVRKCKQETRWIKTDPNQFQRNTSTLHTRLRIEHISHMNKSCSQ